MAPLLRPLLALLLVLGLVLPKASAALGALLGGPRVVVLCTGDGLVTVVLDAGGRPLTADAAREPCGLLAPLPALGAPAHAWSPAGRRLAPATPAAPAPRPARVTGLPPPRAPPAA